MIFKPKEPEFEVQRLDLRPGDTIVITSPRRVSKEVFERLKNIARESFPDNKIIVLEAGLDLKVVREEDEPQEH